MALGGSKVVNAYSQAEAGALSRLLTQPAFWFAAFLAAVAAGLLLPWRLPLGPNAWDTAVYLDAIHRIDVGQVPSIDFFAPVGPLGYYLAACSTGSRRTRSRCCWSIGPCYR
jgi:hypothetical protein